MFLQDDFVNDVLQVLLVCENMMDISLNKNIAVRENFVEVCDVCDFNPFLLPVYHCRQWKS